MKTFPLRVLAPERTFFDGACTSLTVPSIDGIYGLMAQHEDIVLAIVPGKLTLRDADGVEQIAAVSEGVLKMEHGEALVLVDTIERPEEIDLHRAEEMAAEARAEPQGEAQRAGAGHCQCPHRPRDQPYPRQARREINEKTKIRTARCEFFDLSADFRPLLHTFCAKSGEKGGEIHGNVRKKAAAPAPRTRPAHRCAAPQPQPAAHRV